MNNQKVLLVPTYWYLSLPIIQKLASIKRNNVELLCLEVFQPRADFGSLPNVALFSKRYKLAPMGRWFNPLMMRRLQKKIIKLLTKIDPSWIITFSDVTFFVRCLKNTTYEKRLMVIQPCLLGAPPLPKYRKGLYLIGFVFNKLFRCPIYRTHHHWGELLNQAHYIVWSRSELQQRKIKGVISYCGCFFFENTPKQQVQHRAFLILVPALSFYSVGQIDTLIQVYKDLLSRYPKTLFEFKYHPLDSQRLSLANFSNYVEIDEFNIEDVLKYRLVVAGYTNLAIPIRLIYSNVIIFDLCGSVARQLTYFDPRFFYIPQNANGLKDIIRKIDSSAFELDKPDYKSTFFSVEQSFISLLSPCFIFDGSNNGYVT